MKTVMFRGRPTCECLARWLPAFEAELKRHGVIKKSIDIAQLTGAATASGGTHRGGGAFDVWQRDPVTIYVARQMGADATWHRTRAQGFPEHAHGVLRGCPHNEPARYQIDAVDAGYNGLGKGGRGARDDGPRPLSGRTWEQGIVWARVQARRARLEKLLARLEATKVGPLRRLRRARAHKLRMQILADERLI